MDTPTRLSDLNVHREAREYLRALTAPPGAPSGVPSEMATRIRAAVAAGDLSALRNASAAFLQVVAQKTIVDQLMPFFLSARVNAPILDLANDLVAHIVPEGAAVPIDRLVVTSSTLRPQKLENIFIFFQEDTRNERAFEQMLLQFLRTAWDNAFVDALVAASTAVSGDLAALVAFVSGGQPRAPIFITSATGAAALAEHGGLLFQDVAIEGTGTILGVRQFTSPHAGARLLLIDAGHVAVNDAGLQIDRATQPTLEMSDVPIGSASTPTAVATVSLYQTDSLGLKAQRLLSWAFLTPDAIGHLAIDVSGS